MHGEEAHSSQPLSSHFKDAEGQGKGAAGVDLGESSATPPRSVSANLSRLFKEKDKDKDAPPIPSTSGILRRDLTTISDPRPPITEELGHLTILEDSRSFGPPDQVETYDAVIAPSERLAFARAGAKTREMERQRNILTDSMKVFLSVSPAGSGPQDQPSEEKSKEGEGGGTGSSLRVPSGVTSKSGEGGKEGENVPARESSSWANFKSKVQETNKSFREVFTKSVEEREEVAPYVGFFVSDDQDIVPRVVKEEGEDHWLISPESLGRVVWDLFVGCLIFFQAVWIPVEIAFGPRYGLDSIMEMEMANLVRGGVGGWICDCIFLVDVALNFVTAYWSQGVLVKKWPKVVVRYLTTWFLIDFVASLPWRYMLEDQSQQQQNVPKALRLLKLGKALRLAKLLRALKLTSLINRFEDLLENALFLYAYVLVKYFMLASIVAHLLTCMWYLVGWEEYMANEDPKMRRYYGLYRSWIEEEGVVDADFATAYCSALFFVVETMCTVGYGRFFPVSAAEQITAILIFFCSAWVLGYGMSIVSSRSPDENNVLLQAFALKAEELKAWLRKMRHGVPKGLRKRIVHFLTLHQEFHLKHKGESDEILGLLSLSLRREVQQFVRRHVLRNFGMLEGSSEGLLVRLVLRLIPLQGSAGDLLFEPGEVADCMFFLASGAVKLSGFRQRGDVTLCSGSHFGELSLLVASLRACRARCSSFCELYVLTTVDFLEVLQARQEFPDEQRALNSLAEEVMVASRSSEESELEAQFGWSKDGLPFE
eukprot:Cvel_26913.t1-p1 / transcript=Cvel_26913.t1 / gene=Cvel_26913 / organism=Chromera_velia_CCMP2878 / gene_product=Potassium/sodium hyperpolarization-activated cyclic, putative / transcript_product=Potassium/sodium hyperpolarization-activated cyclic, putative / location=Cvel_scaffold3272:12391-18531(+) / protein_length=766 / sequence_SO=supercontig / SO=protein_coding / is_pseudo=false